MPRRVTERRRAVDNSYTPSLAIASGANVDAATVATTATERLQRDGRAKTQKLQLFTPRNQIPVKASPNSCKPIQAQVRKTARETRECKHSGGGSVGGW